MGRLDALSRIGWSAGSQVASSGSNLVFSIIVARSIDTSLLGVFALLMAIFSIGVGLLRGLTSEPLVFKEKAVQKFTEKYRYDSVLNAAAVLSVLLSMVAVAIGMMLSVGLHTLLVFCAFIPVALLQDSVRFALNDLGRGKVAFVIEVVWITVQLPLMIFLGNSDLERLIVFWGAGALCSCIVGLIVLRTLPSLRYGLDWLRIVWRIGFVYCSDFFVSSGINQLTVVVLVLVASYDDAGELRAAQILLTPLMVFTLGASFALGPESARLRKAGSFRQLSRLPWLYAIGVAAFGALSILAITFAPDEVLEFLMGESAQAGAALAPVAALAICLMGMSVGSGLVLRAIGKVGQSVVAKAAIAPLTLAAVGAGSWMAGAAGSQLGLSVGNLLRAVTAGTLAHRNLAKLDKERMVRPNEK